MSEPLNDFLESVEAYMNDPYMTDAQLGERIRVAWENMSEAEKAMNEFIKRHRDPREPVAVKIPFREE